MTLSVTVIPGGAAAAGPVGGGKVYGYNNITNVNNVTVAQANPQRTQITFHNPGSQDIFISPVKIQNTLGTAPTQPANATFTPTTAALGGTFRVYANGGTTIISGECQGAWQALAASGTTNPLTVMDSNV